MLIATLITLFVLLMGGGGAGIETLFNGIESDDVEVVQDSDKRSKIVDLSEQLAEQLAGNVDQWTDQVDQFFEAQKDYTSQESGFKDHAEQLEQTLADRHRMVLKTRSEMKSLMSKEEWDAVFSKR